MKTHKDLKVEFDSENEFLYSVFKLINNEYVSYPFMCLSSYQQNVVLYLVREYQNEKYLEKLEQDKNIPF